MNVGTKCAKRTYYGKTNWHEKVLIDLGYLDKTPADTKRRSNLSPKILEGGCRLYMIAS